MSKIDEISDTLVDLKVEDDKGNQQSNETHPDSPEPPEYPESELEKPNSVTEPTTGNTTGEAEQPLDTKKSDVGQEDTEITDQIDPLSVYVGNVDYDTTPAELKEFFDDCGEISRITILYDPYTGKPKGYAYVEFETGDAAQLALGKHGNTFREREIRVQPKRANIPYYKRRQHIRRGRNRRPNGTRRPKANQTEVY